MSGSVTIVINAAGMGSRLGLQLPKAMVQVLGKPIIAWQFSIIPNDIQTIVVVGYKGRDLANIVKNYRPNTTIVINHRYNETQTAGSFGLGSNFTRNRLISLDGDLMTTKADLEYFINSNENLLGISKVNSDIPVYVDVTDSQITKFSYEDKSQYEWSGLANISTEIAKNVGEQHMFQGLQNFLPIKAWEINSVEVDEYKDIAKMEKWITENL
jgi:choline kinase